MEKFEKNRMLLEKIKWLGLVLGCLMYWLTYEAFGTMISVALGVCFAVVFFLLCEREKNTPLANFIMNDLSQTLKNIGQEDFVFELKGGNAGFIVRIYLVKPKRETVVCNKAIIERISKSDYRPYIWITQIIEVDSEEEIKDARKALNDDLVEDAKQRKEEYKKKKPEYEKLAERINNGEQISEEELDQIIEKYKPGAPDRAMEKRIEKRMKDIKEEKEKKGKKKSKNNDKAED